MADELNIPTHRWYEPRNNIRLAKEDFSKQWIYDSGIQKIDAWINSQPWGNPATTLFSVAGSRGFFYDFSDYSTQFTDTAGTTPVTGTGQSLALVLDESAGLALGSELVTNGDFSDGLTGWTDASTPPATITVVDDALQLFSDGVARARARASQTTVVGRTYSVTFVVLSGTVEFNCGTTFAGTEYFGGGSFSVGTHTRLVLATATTMHIQVHKGGAGTGIADNISVRELPGNHATQATAGNRPLTQVRPMFTQRNRAVGSELPENATYWPASISSNGITATKVASGIDTDGLPYSDYSVIGTATAVSIIAPYLSSFSRTPASVGQTWNASFIVRRLSGTAPPALCGVRFYVQEEIAPSTFNGSFGGPIVEPTLTDTVVTGSYTFATAGTNQAFGQIDIRTASGATVNYNIRIKAFQFELGSTRTTYQPAVSGELRNRATGSGAVDNTTYWPTSAVSNGITMTKVASGIDTDGLPYADVRYQGTATSTFNAAAYTFNQSIVPAVVGQTFTASMIARLIAGSTANVTGFVVSCAEINSVGAFLASTDASILNQTADTLITATRTLNQATMASTRTGVTLLFTNGATIDVTYRVKALQFEQNATYSRYQRTITANEWYEPGFTSYRGIRFDGTDDFLQTAAINFPAAESLGPELVTNGTFASNITGWSNVSDAGGTIAWNPLGYLDLINTTGTARAQQNFVVTAGRTYKFVVSNPGANTVDVYAGSTSGGIELLATTLTAGQTGTYILTATSSLMSLGFRNFGAGTTDSIDNVSVKEVLIPADKMTVVAGVRKLSDASALMITELGPDAATTDGSFALFQPLSTGYRARSRGTAQADATSAVFPAPETAVLTMQSDISGDAVFLRRNATQVGFAGNDQGTGNYRNDIVYIGRKAGTTLPFNGILTFLCVINRVLTAAELAQLEAFANNRTGAY